MCVIYVFCLIVVPLPPGKNPFAVKIIIITITMIIIWCIFSGMQPIAD
jgi:hypothetical protein